MRSSWALAPAVLCAAVSVLGCNEPIADRCYMNSDCKSGLVCSNGEDRSFQGLCVEPPEAGPDGGADAGAGGGADAATDGGDGGGDASS